MATDHDTDRDAFGHWLAGFADGEGCFYLGWMVRRDRLYPRPIAYFYITLRSDDRAILESIRSYWGAGSIYGHSHTSKDRNSRPRSSFWVHRAREVGEVIIPHFERHPLRAKKRRDFEIWRQGAGLIYSVWQRPYLSRGRHGALPKWSDAEREQFGSLVVALREQRQFPGEGVPEMAPPPRGPGSGQLDLFVR